MICVTWYNLHLLRINLKCIGNKYFHIHYIHVIREEIDTESIVRLSMSSISTAKNWYGTMGLVFLPSEEEVFLKILFKMGDV